MVSPDFTASMLVISGFVATGAAYGLSVWSAGCRARIARLDRERALPLLGKAPLEAVYTAVLPLGRAFANAGISANAVTVVSLLIATVAGVLFATGHFGLGAATAVVASMADALDGIIARESGTVSKYGQILDTTVDRYVDALLVGGIAFLVRDDAALLVLSLAALVGSFMVSYASSLLREIGAPDANAPMRRAHRLGYLLAGALLVPLVQAAWPEASRPLQLAPVLVPLAAIAIVGNVSAVRRLLSGAARATTKVVPASTQGGPSARVGRSSAGIDVAVANERVSHP